MLRGRRRVESDRFVALRSHYLYESTITRRGREGAHEKGGVEGEVGRFRRRHLVPIPTVASLAELNDVLEDACFAELERRIQGRPETVGEALRRESRALRELPVEDYETAEQASPRVDSKALVTVRQNRYSVPVSLVGLRVGAKIGARELVVSHPGREVARHPRLYARFQVAARLDHYLELLRRKPGALKGSLPLAQERRAGAGRAPSTSSGGRSPGRWSMSACSAASTAPPGSSSPSRGALAAGAHDGRAVVLLARRSERPAQLPLAELAERLRASDRPEPSLGDYDALLRRGSRP